MDEVYLHKIDTTKLPADTYVFDAVSLTSKLDISQPYSSDEFIFLYRIPSESLSHTRSLGEIEEQGTYGIVTNSGTSSADGQTEAEVRHYAARPFNPDYHYVPELNGWYDTDEECEELNRADDLMKMIEGDWN